MTQAERVVLRALVEILQHVDDGDLELVGEVAGNLAQALVAVEAAERLEQPHLN
jgi:hypothetical protein